MPRDRHMHRSERRRDRSPSPHSSSHKRRRREPRQEPRSVAQIDVSFAGKIVKSALVEFPELRNDFKAIFEALDAFQAIDVMDIENKAVRAKLLALFFSLSLEEDEGSFQKSKSCKETFSTLFREILDEKPAVAVAPPKPAPIGPIGPAMGPIGPAMGPIGPAFLPEQERQPPQEDEGPVAFNDMTDRERVAFEKAKMLEATAEKPSAWDSLRQGQKAGKPVRENWMTQLPTERTSSAGSGIMAAQPRTFSMHGKAKLDSSWSEGPRGRARPIPKTLEEVAREVKRQRCVVERKGQTAVEDARPRPKSLMELFAEKQRAEAAAPSKKKKEKGVVGRSVTVRRDGRTIVKAYRPFDRERDLEISSGVNRNALNRMADSKELRMRFSKPTVQRSFL